MNVLLNAYTGILNLILQEINGTFISRANDFQIQIDLSHIDADVTNRYCICSEFCSMNSFFFYNPLMRFTLCQNHRYAMIPDQYIVPYYVRAIVNVTIIERTPLSTLVESMRFYLDRQISHEMAFFGYVMRDYRRTDTPGIVIGAYELMRSYTSVNIFKELRNPFKNMDAFAKYADVIQWIRDRFMFKDAKLDETLYYKLFILMPFWTRQILANVSSSDIVVGHYECAYDLLTQRLRVLMISNEMERNNHNWSSKSRRSDSFLALVEPDSGSLKDWRGFNLENLFSKPKSESTGTSADPHVHHYTVIDPDFIDRLFTLDIMDYGHESRVLQEISSSLPRAQEVDDIIDPSLKQFSDDDLSLHPKDRYQIQRYQRHRCLINLSCMILYDIVSFAFPQPFQVYAVHQFGPTSPDTLCTAQYGISR